MPMAIGDPSNTSDSTSMSLIVRVQRREEQAWERLKELYGPMMHQWVRQLNVPESDTLDVTQEVFMDVARTVADFEKRADSGGFRMWLRTITWREVCDYFKKKKNQPKLDNVAVEQVAFPADDEASAATEMKLLWDRAWRIIRQDFEEQTAEVFERIVINEENAQTVAASLDMTVKAVHQAKYRVLKRLRDEFGPVIE